MIGYFLQEKETFADRARYVLRQLARMMGVKMIEINDLVGPLPALDALLIYGRSMPSVKIELPIFFCAQADYDQAATLAPHDVRAIVTTEPDLPQKIINLFSGHIQPLQNSIYADEKSSQVMLSASENKIFCAVDILAACFYFLSLENERHATQRDQFDRFQRQFSPVGEQIYDNPTVDRYARLLRALLLRLAPNMRITPVWPDNRRFAVALSHDVDRIPTWTITKVRRVMRPQGSPYANPIVRSCRLLRSLSCPENWLGNFNYISALDRSYAAASTFFFVSRHRQALDPTYKMTSPWLRRGVATLQRRGCDIGLHGTIPSAGAGGLLQLEKEALESVVDREVLGNRQHYLCYSDATLQLWREAKIKYDSTLGFSDYIGYRCGTGFPFQMHDGDGQTPLLEIPLILMDTVLFLESKQHLAAADAWPVVERHLQEARANNGLLTINWHSSDLHPIDVNGYSLLYIKILNWTQENGGWLASLNQVYNWWTVR